MLRIPATSVKAQMMSESSSLAQRSPRSVKIPDPAQIGKKMLPPAQRGIQGLSSPLCAAFAAPLLHHTRSESGGYHFVGPSSTGKSTALIVAGSVWGGGGTGGYVRSWRTTANGLEGTLQPPIATGFFASTKWGRPTAGRLGQAPICSPTAWEKPGLIALAEPVR